ncbi:MAG: hypothetical protein DRJ98_01225 [Thermoprotei archaeon]|nr:MAG: hypothetical protein DRJ98_01225 [Thermoprotei archaeon]
MGRVQVRVHVYPTEDEDKVKRAVENLFSLTSWTAEGLEGTILLTGRSDTLLSLAKLRERLRKQRTLDAARYMIKRFSTGDKLVFYLHKQAAYSGHAVFCLPEAESPLGPIEVEVEGSDLKRILDWLAPPTVNGKPRFEVPMPEDP